MSVLARYVALALGGVGATTAPARAFGESGADRGLRRLGGAVARPVTLEAFADSLQRYRSEAFVSAAHHAFASIAALFPLLLLLFHAPVTALGVAVTAILLLGSCLIAGGAASLLWRLRPWRVALLTGVRIAMGGGTATRTVLRLSCVLAASLLAAGALASFLSEMAPMGSTRQSYRIVALATLMTQAWVLLATLVATSLAALGRGMGVAASFALRRVAGAFGRLAERGAAWCWMASAGLLTAGWVLAFGGP